MLKKIAKQEQGQVVVENLICILLICLIFFGILQLFFMFIADSVVSYGSFTTARSISVGFKPKRAHVAAEISTIPAAGKRLKPINLYDSYANQSALLLMVEEYIRGDRTISYEYWRGDNEFSDSTAPFNEERRTYLFMNESEKHGDGVEAEVGFDNYPLAMPMRMINFGTEYTDIESKAVLPKYYNKFMDR
ncbi:hypothetical protein AAEX28_00685 [Lentisphaerota bacterium WC36G]|nr:hypothetical protein LJT99_03565 [Lentisphaerae bacterium WC36]